MASKISKEPFRIKCPCGREGELAEFAAGAGGGGGCDTCGHGAVYYVHMTCPACGKYDSTDL